MTVRQLPSMRPFSSRYFSTAGVPPTWRKSQGLQTMSKPLKCLRIVHRHCHKLQHPSVGSVSMWIACNRHTTRTTTKQGYHATSVRQHFFGGLCSRMTMPPHMLPLLMTVALSKQWRIFIALSGREYHGQENSQEHTYYAYLMLNE